MARTLKALREARAQLAKTVSRASTPARISLSAAADYDTDTAPDWDGSYLGTVRIGNAVLAGTPGQLTRLARHLVIAAHLATAAHELDTSRPGTLSMNGGEA